MSVIRKNIRNLRAYKPPLEQRSNEDYLLLDFNERTTAVPDHIISSLNSFNQGNKIIQYPAYGDVLEKLAVYTDVDPSQLILTNGSGQGINIVMSATTEPGDKAIIPVPTFALLTHVADVLGLEIESPHYTKDFQYPFEAVCDLIDKNTKLIVVCNPSSPHGTILEVDKIVELAKLAPNAAILVDECYFEYALVTAKDYVKEFPNLFITRTLSKTWGLAALRLGYIISQQDNINELYKVRGPYDVNSLAVAALNVVLDDPQFMIDYTNEVREKARPYFEQYLASKGIPYVPSQSNYILCFPDDCEGMEQSLRENNILVRPRSGPGVEASLRFSIGTVEQMKLVTKVMDSFLDKP